MVGGKEINPGRKHANHRFVGPGYSIAHPGIFPHNVKAQAFTIKKWLEFDWRAGWGTTEFEDKVADGKVKVDFPEALGRCRSTVKMPARSSTRISRSSTSGTRSASRSWRTAAKVDGPYIESDPRVGRALAFSYKIKNTNTGHNLPSGSLGAQPQLWVNVALIDPDGQNVWESGYVDSNGDMADLHSLDVAAGSIKTDQQLVHFQTKFLTDQRQGHGPRNVPAGELRRRSSCRICVRRGFRPPFSTIRRWCAWRTTR